MSSIYVAPEAASARTPVPVTSRELLWTGGVIEISVPVDAAEQTFKEKEMEEDVHYLQFPRNIKGGVVNCFVHTTDSSLRGRKITAEVSVMRKTLADGRAYLYIDLRPVEKRITHRIAIVVNEPGMWLRDDLLVFETPEPLRGAIILAHPDAKLTPSAPVPVIQRIAPPSLRIGTTGDRQLDRLLADGWEIEKDDGARVSLFKMKSGGRRYLTHHRQKRNGKNI